MLDPNTSALILYDGMSNGWFTGVGLPKYFNSTVEDPVNARRNCQRHRPGLADRGLLHEVQGSDRASPSASASSDSPPLPPRQLPSSRARAADRRRNHHDHDRQRSAGALHHQRRPECDVVDRAPRPLEITALGRTEDRRDQRRLAAWALHDCPGDLLGHLLGDVRDRLLNDDLRRRRRIRRRRRWKDGPDVALDRDGARHEKIRPGNDQLGVIGPFRESRAAVLRPPIDVDVAGRVLAWLELQLPMPRTEISEAGSSPASARLAGPACRPSGYPCSRTPGTSGGCSRRSRPGAKDR